MLGTGGLQPVRHIQPLPGATELEPAKRYRRGILNPKFGSIMFTTYCKLSNNIRQLITHEFL